jgi:hypothetical protein
MRCKFVVFFALIFGFLAITQAAVAASQLKLVASQSLNTPANFLSPEAVTFDANYIYAASAQGVLYIKSRSSGYIVGDGTRSRPPQ